LRFLIDMPLSPALAGWLTQQGHDAVHALHLGLDRSPDEIILARARDDGRVVITADLDYPRLLALTQAEGPGLILFRGGDYSEEEALDRLRVALDKVAEADLPHSVVVIEKARIRQRRLPI
jgi:predicted nuclease of predicted toxin-antitoxin system